jgi:hypothetical protein
MIAGFKYTLFRTLISNGQTASFEVDTNSPIINAPKEFYSSFCIKLKCGGQTPICVY